MPSSSENPVSEHPAFEPGTLLGHLGDDDTAMRELLALYLEEAPRLRAALRAAVGGGSAEPVRRAAHALKGTLNSITAYPAGTAAEVLEHMGRTGEVRDAAGALANVETQLDQLEAAVQRFLAERSAS